jgi:hypothetical protein
LIYFMYIACFRPIDHRVESELPENFLDASVLEQKQAGFVGKCP